MEVDEFLEHHGIMGMKWGVRRSRVQLSKEHANSGGKPSWHSPPAPKPKAPESKAPKISSVGVGRVKTPPSQDALEIHALRQKVKKHGMSSLTNEDLQKIAKRAELQQKYNTAFPKKPSAASIAGKMAVGYVLSKDGNKAISTFATTKLSHPYLANTLHDLFKPGGPASQIDQMRKLSEQAKNKGNKKK